MKKVIRFFSPYKKWLLIIPYLLTIFFAWHRRYTAYQYIPLLFRRTLLGDLLPDIVLLALAFTGFVCLVQLLRYPLFQKRRFLKAFERIGLHNNVGEYPVLVSKRPDKLKKYGTIYQLKNVGISIADVDTRNAQLEAALGLKIYRYEYAGRKAQKILLYAIPRKHAKPIIISPEDEYFGSEKVSSMINCLVVGATGTGKTVALKILMKKIVKYQPTAKIWILDFKQYDFRELSDCPTHYGYLDCIQGLNDFYNAFKKQQSSGVAGCPQYLFCDEWSALVLSREKRQAEELKERLSEILMLGRSYHFYAIIGLQRGDSSYFSSGARDQFRNILLLGNCSKEQKTMLVPAYKDKLVENNGIGEGYLVVDGKGVDRVKIAPIKDFEALNDTIRQAMSH